ncbi:MAG: hypothetical protein JJE46_00560 [Acidimicrobiia bacterium]|nr:hypothetical protein [Acidimicrobiia bacterium]
MNRFVIFTKTIRDQRRGIFAWGISIAALVVVMALMWPTVRDMPDLKRLLSNYPEALRKIFKIDTYGTPAGYLNAELFSLILPAVFLVFSIGRGARLIAGEEEDHTLDVLLCAAPSRSRVAFEKAAALVVTVGALGGILFMTMLLSSWAIDMRLAIGDIARGTIAVTALSIEFGLLALAVGAISGRRSTAAGISTLIAAAAFVLYLLGQLITAFEPWRGLSPFTQALDHGPLGPEWSIGTIAMCACGAAVFAAALPRFTRRDIRT